MAYFWPHSATRVPVWAAALRHTGHQAWATPPPGRSLPGHSVHEPPPTLLFSASLHSTCDIERRDVKVGPKFGQIGPEAPEWPKGRGDIPDGKGTFIFNVYMYLSLTINCEILHSTFQMHTQLENILICIHTNDY